MRLKRGAGTVLWVHHMPKQGFELYWKANRKLFHLNLNNQTKRKLKQKTHRGLIVECQALVNWGKHSCKIIF